MRKAEYDELSYDQKIELFDLTDDPGVRGYIFFTTGIPTTVWFRGEKEPNPKEGPYLVLEHVNPENCKRLRLTAFNNAGQAIDSREVDWQPNSIFGMAVLETAICELTYIAARLMELNPPSRREGHRLDPALQPLRTIKVENVMKLVKEAEEQERRTGRKITDEFGPDLPFSEDPRTHSKRNRL